MINGVPLNNERDPNKIWIGFDKSFGCLSLVIFLTVPLLFAICILVSELEKEEKKKTDNTRYHLSHLVPVYLFVTDSVAKEVRVRVSSLEKKYKFFI